MDINKNKKADIIGYSIAKTIIEIENKIIKKVINNAFNKIFIGYLFIGFNIGSTYQALYNCSPTFLCP